MIDRILLPSDRCADDDACNEGQVCGDNRLCVDGIAVGNLVEELRATGTHGTLLAALDAAQLTAVVAEQPELTVFAPTDEAFDNLEAANPGILAALLAPENIDLLQAILLNHVLAGATTRQQAEGQSRLYSLRPSVLEIAGDGGRATVGGAAVAAWDQPASNGIFHILNAVIALPGDQPRGGCSVPANIEGFGFWIGDNTGAGASQLSTCGDEARGREQVFSWTAPATGSVCVDTFGSSIDTVLHARSGVCASRRFELACNDDAGDSLTSSITLDVVEGTAYFLLLDSFDLDQNGRYILSVTSGACAE